MKAHRGGHFKRIAGEASTDYEDGEVNRHVDHYETNKASVAVVSAVLTNRVEDN